MEIFQDAGGIILSRWVHYLAGITWIGLLYYFNFVQVPSFATFEAGTRNEAIDKLVPRALWWFRWGAVLTLLSGIMILATQGNLTQDNYFAEPAGVSISTGMLLAIIMFMNVWMVIWPNQRKVIANARNVIAGGEADPTAAAAGRKALLASRTNALFSIPMLFFMGATGHFRGNDGSGLSNYVTEGNVGKFWGPVVLIILLLELNALGVLGGTGQGPLRKYLDSHRDTIIAGFVLWVVIYLIWEFAFSA